MKAKELRDFSASDLTGRINQWKEEVFRSRFKMENAEARDTSIIRKLRRNIARACTILTEKNAKGTTEAAAPKAASAVVQDKPAKAAKTTKPKAKAKTAKASE